MKLLVIFVLTLLFFSNAFASVESETKTIQRACAAQIMAVVKSADMLGKVRESTEKSKTAKSAPDTGIKTVVFNKTTDAEFVRVLDDSESLGKKLQAAPTDKVTAQKFSDVMDKAIALSEKSAPKEMAACADWMKAATTELRKICPEVDSGKLSKLESDHCNEKAAEVPAVKEKQTKWMELAKKLIVKN